MEDARADLSSGEILEFNALLHTLVDEVRGIILDRVSTGLAIEAKIDRSLVTTADRDAERHFRQRIAALHPEASILGEEEPLHDTGSDFLWIIDPVDGTQELVHQSPLFGSVVALYYKGLPIAGCIDHPRLQVRVHAAYGHGCFRNEQRIRISDTEYRYTENYLSLPPLLPYLRKEALQPMFDALTRKFPNYRTFFCCFAGSQACSGNVDASLDLNCHLWDISANKLLIEEAGGAYTQWTYPGDDNDTLYTTITGKPAIVELLTTIVEPFLHGAGLTRNGN